MRRSAAGLGQRRARRAAPDEAEEDRGLLDEGGVPLEAEEDGEALSEAEAGDYRELPHLDEYDSAELDDAEYAPLDAETRRRAEAEMVKREEISEGDSAVGGDYSTELRQRRGGEFAQAEAEEDEEAAAERFLDVEQIRGKLPQWIREPETRRFIRRAFRHFLLQYSEEGKGRIYEARLMDMCAHNRASLELTFNHLTGACPTLAYWLFEAPALLLPELNAVAYELACKFFAGFVDMQPEITVRVGDFPLVEQLRELRTHHLNTLVRIEGVVTKRHAVASQLKKLFYICRCGDRKGPLFVSEGSRPLIGACAVCQARPPFAVDSEETQYRSHQRLTVQESPSAVPPGRVPRHKEVILLGDCVDAARPGDEVAITGVYTCRPDFAMNARHGFPVFSTHLEANHVQLCRARELETADEADRRAIAELSRNARVFDILVDAIAPSIFGQRAAKRALVLALLGGTPSQRAEHRVRGDVNVLLLGDPGLGKSQLLKYAQGVAARSIYTTGRGASAVGLTASVHKDPATGEWALEGGAMVLADTGVCLIDEFDKMSDQDRTSIHEAMEQQTISVSKAGIVASLQARCAVIAAANPLRGRYDSQLSFMDNVNLSEPILSRFDVVCVLRDEVDLAEDARIARFVVASHRRSAPETAAPAPEPQGEISQALLRKYIAYARANVRPELSDDAKERLSSFYTRLRAESLAISGLNIVVRHFESLIRFAQASAKAHLRARVAPTDVDLAIQTLLDSFIETQKPAAQKGLRSRFAAELRANRDTLPQLAALLNQLVKENAMMQRVGGDVRARHTVRIPLAKFQLRARDQRVFDVRDFLASSLFAQNYALDGDVIVKEF